MNLQYDSVLYIANKMSRRLNFRYKTNIWITRTQETNVRFYSWSEIYIVLYVFCLL